MITTAAIKSSDGIVHTGTRHCYIIRDMIVKGYPKPINGIQGFVSDTNEFLTREQAAAHVLLCKQINELQWPPLLYSEDLW